MAKTFFLYSYLIEGEGAREGKPTPAGTLQGIHPHIWTGCILRSQAHLEYCYIK